MVAAPGSCYVRWPQRAFYELQQEEDSDFGYAIQLMIARTLSEKLSAARLSQRESEQKLNTRLAATFRGARPRTRPSGWGGWCPGQAPDRSRTCPDRVP